MIVDKPLGWTCLDVARTLKRLTKEKKIGHLGTLDPLATGVLPIFLGKATKLIYLFEGLSKTYRATIRLGQTTDTLDAEGQIIAEYPTQDLTPEAVTQAILSFRGTIRQQTPAFSAVKSQGIPAYELARKGQIPVPKEREVQIEDLDIEEVKLPEVTFRVQCSKGTYIRSLANDIGQALGNGAHLKALRRLACGTQFRLEEAKTLGEVEAILSQPEGTQAFAPLRVLNEFPTLCVTPAELEKLVKGQALMLAALPSSIASEAAPQTWCVKAVDSQQNLIAIGAFHWEGQRGQFHPSKLLI